MLGLKTEPDADTPADYFGYKAHVDCCLIRSDNEIFDNRTVQHFLLSPSVVAKIIHAGELPESFCSSQHLERGFRDSCRYELHKLRTAARRRLG